MPSEDLNKTLKRTFGKLKRSRENYVPSFTPREIGYVMSVSSGVVRVSGLKGAGFEELLKFPNDLFGIAYNLDEHEIGVILLGEDTDLNVGDEVEPTGRVLDIPVGEDLIGRVINPLGNPLDEKGNISFNKRMPIQRPAPAIMDRAAVTVPLQTGIKVVDALVPIGRGQRELILGDRQTGKTAIAIDAILNQKDKNVLCVYCAISQRSSSVAKVIANLKDKGAMEYTVVVVAEGNNSPGLKYIAPYAATSIAEYFMEQGRDVLIVYDDLTHHARAYRELSLLLRRPPGREAFPGDIFYIHSKLLERATHLSEDLGGGSLTALPIIETEAQNISAYIPTNLISINDGQLYLSPKLFEQGILPAVDIGKSVSRVGGKAQFPAFQAITGNLKLAYSQFEELESFARFGTRLDDDTKKKINHGKRIREGLKQPELQPMSVPEQIMILLALTNGRFDTIPLDKMQEAEDSLLEKTKDIPKEIIDRIFADKKLSDEDKQSILEIADEKLSSFQEKQEEKKDLNIMDTLESLRRKLAGAGDLKSVVRTMKTMAASNIGQYESAVNSLGDYYRTVTLGIIAFFREQDFNIKKEVTTSKETDAKSVCAIVFGSDQGLVGPFNDSLSEFVSNSLDEFTGTKEIWVVGERIQYRLMDLGFNITKLFSVPNSVNAITSLVREILIKSLEKFETENSKEYYLFHNQPKSGTGYKPVMQRLLPLDKKWIDVLREQDWPTKNLPQVAGGRDSTLKSLIREFLFVSLFKASAESSVSENSSRLAAMQRAEKNIDEMLDDLGGKFHHRRQSAIDEELFDLISGFEALKEDPKTIT